MSGGRTVWQAQDSGWWRRERIVLLGEQFGAEGPALANWLECEAKAQNDAGHVKAGYTTAARGAFCAGGADRGREIIEFAVRVGFLRDYEPGDLTFTAQIAAYAADQPAGKAAFRQRAKRDEQDVTERDTPAETEPDGTPVTLCHAPSRSVTPSHALSRPSTREERREEKNRTASLRSAGAHGKTDGWPDRLGEALRPAAAIVHGRLVGLAEAKGVAVPSMRRVGEVVADFPDHDHPVVVGDVVDYWQHGAGARTVRKDVVRVYRERCGRVPARRAPLGRLPRRAVALDEHVVAPAGLAGRVCAAVEGLSFVRPDVGVWLAGAHAHREAGGVVVVGVRAESVGWVRERALVGLVERLGCEVRVVACGECDEAGAA